MLPRFSRSFFVVVIAVILIIIALGVVPAQASIQTTDLHGRSAAPVASVAATWVVTSSTDSGAGSLHDTIAAAASGDTITFNGDMTITLSSELVINKSLTIDGEAHAVTVSGGGTTRVFNVTAGNVTFAHLTIANGKVQTLDCGSRGSFTCGGGIMVQNSSVAVTVTNSMLISNSAPSGGYGGGLFNDRGTLTVQNSTFSGNSAPGGYSGGLYNNYGTLTVQNSTLSSNSATYGGGLYNNYGTLMVQNSTFSGNSATYGGGLESGSTPDNCASTPTVTVTNSTFSGNSAVYGGGGLYNYAGVMKIESSTIVSNTAPAGAGGGVRSFNTGDTCTRVGSSIIAGNTGSDVSAVVTTQRFSSLDYNVIGTAGDNVDFTQEFSQTHDLTNVTTPLMSPLADNGGATLTMALLPSSPALDRGSAACPPTDQRVVARPQGAACDSGAFELEQYMLTIDVVGNGSGVVTPTVGSYSNLISGTMVPLTATAGVGSSFIGWSGDLSGNTNPTSILMNAAKVVTATFALQTFTITPTAGAGGSLMPNMPQTVNYGDSITFTIAADTGYHIADVGVDGTSQGALTSYTFNNVTADHTITATFVLNLPVGLSASNDGPTPLGSVTTLTATLSSGLNVTYAWNFGDGSLGAGVVTAHSYATPGTYTASVTATNSAGDVVAQTTVYVTTNPIAHAGPDQSLRTGQPVTLDGNASFDPGNFLPLTYHWQQTGGPAVTLSGADNVTATFASPVIVQTQVLTFALMVTNSQSVVSQPDVVVVTVEPYRIMLPLVLR